MEQVAGNPGRLNPELREIVVEASLALARLDAERLEELAHSCQVLSRDLAPVNDEVRADLERQARESAGEMAVFGRVLEATRANLAVMERVGALREGRLEYGGGTDGRIRAIKCGGPWALPGSRYGDD